MDTTRATARLGERREFGLTSRAEALDAREAAVDERERRVDERLAAIGEIDDQAGRRRQARAERARQREQSALDRRQHDEDVQVQLGSGDYPLAAQFAQLATQLFAVHREFQRRGIGRKLILAARQIAAQSGAGAVSLTTFRKVPWNEPYYQRLGFRTLPDGALTPRLRGILECERRAGLPVEERCAMILEL